MTTWVSRLQAMMLAICVLYAAYATKAFAYHDPAKPLPPSALIERLKQGGYNLFIRHAATDINTQDQHPVDFDNCASQRNLSTQGKQDAKRLGLGLANVGVEVDAIYSSPYCRCQHTAEIAFGRWQVDPKLHFAFRLEKDERERLAEHLRQLLAKPVSPGVNRVVVSHTANLKEAVGVWPQDEGGLYIFAPNPSGEPDYLGNIPPAFWSAP